MKKETKMIRVDKDVYDKLKVVQRQFKIETGGTISLSTIIDNDADVMQSFVEIEEKLLEYTEDNFELFKQLMKIVNEYYYNNKY